MHKVPKKKTHIFIFISKTQFNKPNKHPINQFNQNPQSPRMGNGDIGAKASQSEPQSNIRLPSSLGRRSED